MQQRRAFTLVELLAVVGMLVFLIAMLAPAFYKAQRQAKMVTCLSNLQGLHLAYATYLHQNSERPFLYDPTRQSYWMTILQPMFPDVPNLRFCPEAMMPSYGWGSAKLAWGPYDSLRTPDPSMSFLGGGSSSYGFNAWLYEVPREGDVLHHRRSREPNYVPVFADANWEEGWPLDTDPFPADTNAGSAPGEPDLGRFCVARHGQSINAVFLDGHAEQFDLTSLRNLKWASRHQLFSPNLRPK